MALSELLPPSTLPRGQNEARPLSAASGSVVYIQLYLGSEKVRP